MQRWDVDGLVVIALQRKKLIAEFRFVVDVGRKTRPRPMASAGVKDLRLVIRRSLHDGYRGNGAAVDNGHERIFGRYGSSVKLRLQGRRRQIAVKHAFINVFEAVLVDPRSGLLILR